jgi:hypothetical protein
MTEAPPELADDIWFRPGHLAELAFQRRGDRATWHDPGLAPG